MDFSALEFPFDSFYIISTSLKIPYFLSYCHDTFHLILEHTYGLYVEVLVKLTF